MTRRCPTNFPACLLLAAIAHAAAAQTAPSNPAQNEEPDMPQVSDSGVGYIDTALIRNRVRFRYDAAYENIKPSRAEFFWPVGRPLGPGPGPETSVDYQDLSTYVEWVARPGLSVFGELPYRFVDPELQDNTSGFGDFNAGFKLALRQDCCRTTTFQFRTYIPSADGSRGLGTEHASIEPALLDYRQLTPRVALEMELRDWIAVDGTDGFAGNVLRYGAGLSYRMSDPCCRPLAAVVELVGWTVLDGMTAFAPTPTQRVIEDAEGDTIVNIKLGLRWYVTPCCDVYAGYGQVLTDEAWYDHTLRAEIRRTF
jgi:hypothetical protein